PAAGHRGAGDRGASRGGGGGVMARVYVVTALPAGSADRPEEQVPHTPPTADGPPAGGGTRPGTGRPVVFPPRWLGSAWRGAGWRWAWGAALRVVAVLVGVVAVLVLLGGAVAALVAAVLGVPAPGWWARQVAAAYRRGVAACWLRRGGTFGTSTTEGGQRR